MIHWKLGLALTALGLVYAALTISGWAHGSEGPLSLTLLSLCGAVVGWRARARPFRQGWIAGFLAALVAVEAQALMLETYFANNPGYANIEIPFGLPARLATALLGPVNAALAGLISGAVAWLLWRAFSRLR